MTRAMRILLVDDNPDDRALVARALTKEYGNVEVREVIDRRQLEAALDDGTYDLVVTDYQLKWSDGVAVLREVKQRHATVPTVMFTGTGSEEIAVEAMQSGLDDYVVKSPKHFQRLVPATRRAIERAAHRRERDAVIERVRTILDRLPAGVYRTSLDGDLLYANPAMLELLGYSHDADILGTNVADTYVDADDRRRWIDLMAQEGAVRHFETRIRRFDGSVIWVSDSARRVPDDAGDVVYYEGVIEDVTERKAAEEAARQAEQKQREIEEQIRQVQKMEAVGRLAGGVAHDFNNLLTVILGECDLLLGEPALTGPLRESVEDMRGAAERGALLTRQLLSFSRRQILKPEVFGPNQLVAELGRMFHRLIGENIALETRLGDEVGDVLMDRGQLEQVLVNLVVNARDAMPFGGKLTIETFDVRLTGDEAMMRSDVSPGRYAVISVGDTGIGMSAEVKEHLFEPFFSTKEKGKGTGLGLATSYGIVRQNGGHIGVYTEEGLGTMFRVYLPHTEQRREPTAADTAGALPTGTESILVVEDDESLRDVAVRLLGRLGYRVRAAADAAEAIAAVTLGGDQFDLLLTDVVLPDQGGRELADNVLELSPNTKVLFASGYTEDVILRHRLLERHARLLSKPFTIEDLARHVRSVLDT